jgi:hypothetical protein
VTEPATEWEVQPYDGWASLDDAREQWADAVDMEDDELTQYLASAYEQCVEFAPALAEGQTTIPQRYVQAQIMQARAIWRSITAGDDDGIGPEGFTVTVYPMDWTVKNLLRPKRAVPRVG